MNPEQSSGPGDQPRAATTTSSTATLPGTSTVPHLTPPTAIAMAVELVQLAEREPTHPAIVAVRLAVEVIDLRRAWRRIMRQTSAEVSAATDWRRMAAAHIPYEEMARRRAVPGRPPGGGRVA